MRGERESKIQHSHAKQIPKHELLETFRFCFVSFHVLGAVGDSALSLLLKRILLVIVVNNVMGMY